MSICSYPYLIQNMHISQTYNLNLCHWSIYASRRWKNGTNFTLWWRHQMETFSALLALCVHGEMWPVNSPHKGQWRGTLMFSLICVWTNGWANYRDAGDLRRHHAPYDVTVMSNDVNSIVSLIHRPCTCQESEVAVEWCFTNSHIV